MTTDPESGYSTSVRDAVANEVRRRRRALAIYLVLIALPILLAGYAIARAPSETDLVAQKVTPVVVEQAGDAIDSRVNVAVTQQTGPIIENRVTAKVQAALEPLAASTQNLETRYTELTSQITNLGTAVQSNSQLVQGVGPRLAELDGLPGRVQQAEAVAGEAMKGIASLNEGQQALRNTVDRSNDQNQRIEAMLGRLENRLGGIDERLSSLEKTVAAMRRTRPGLDQTVPGGRIQ